MSDTELLRARRNALVGGPIEKLRAIRTETRSFGAPVYTQTALADADEREIPLPVGYVKGVNALVFSASQVETWKLCARKWLGEKVFKLPVPPKGFLNFGTTLHSVCERYLKADDLGRDKQGNPVNLYPQGWDAQVSKIEADLIQKLIARAIEGDEKGRPVLVRHPRRRVEHGFLRPLVEVDGITVFITGWIDYLRPFEAVEDHKTTKDLKWAKKENPESPEYLGKSRQMLIYARELLVQAEEAGEFPPQHILVQHNYYCKNPTKPAVKVVQALVSHKEILDHWEDLKTIAVDMVRSRKRHVDLNYWHDFPLPPNQARACEAFGGCNYRTICGGLETPHRYMTRQQENAMNQTLPAVALPALNGPVPTTQPGVNIVSMRKIPAAPPPQPAQPPRNFNLCDPMTEEVRLVPEAELRGIVAQYPGNDFYVLLEGEVSAAWKTPRDYGILPPPSAGTAPPTPPWFVQACPACSTGQNPGFNTQGNPCRICYGRSAPENHPNNFDIRADGQGNVSWTRKPDAASTQTQAPPAQPTQQAMPAAVPQAQIPVQAPQPTAPPPPPQQGAPATAPEKPAAPRRGPGRPRKATQGDPPAAIFDGISTLSTPPSPAPTAPQQPTSVARTTTPVAAGTPPSSAPRTGFTILLNCLSTKDGRADLADTLKKWGDLLAQSRQAASYFHLDTFERRNLIAGEAAQIAAELSGKVHARADKSSDMAALVDALRPYAEDVIVGAA